MFVSVGDSKYLLMWLSVTLCPRAHCAVCCYLSHVPQWFSAFHFICHDFNVVASIKNVMFSTQFVSSLVCVFVCLLSYR